MMGFHRIPPPQALDRAAIRAEVIPLLRDELSFIARTQDPFGIEHGCVNPAGHAVITSCGAIVCAHCSKVFWS
jgi:hypothetical protein